MADKYSPNDFAARIKSKFPEYKEMSDMNAIKTHLDKYPGDSEYLAPFSEQQKAEFSAIEDPFKQQPKAPEEVSAAQAFAQGLGQGATLNFGEELGLQDKARIQEASKQQPMSYLGGEIVGGLPYDIATGGLLKLAKIPKYAALIEKFPALKRAISPAALETAKGTVSGIGGGEEGDRMVSGILGGTLTGGVAYGLPKIPGALESGANYMATKGMMPTASQLEKLRLKGTESASDVIQRLGKAAREYGLTSPFQSASTRLGKVLQEQTDTGLLPTAVASKQKLIKELEQAGATGATPEEIAKRISTLPERFGATTPEGEIMAIRRGEISPPLRKIQETLGQYQKTKEFYGMKPPEVNYQPPRMPISGDIPLEKMTENIPIPLSEMDKIARNIYESAQLRQGKQAQVLRAGAKDIRSMVQEQAEPIAQQIGRAGELAQSNKDIRDLMQLQNLLKTQTEKEATLSPLSLIPSSLGAGYTMASGGEPTDYARNVLLANLLMRGRGYRGASNILGGASKVAGKVDPLAEALAQKLGVSSIAAPVTRAITTGE